jgi:ABC-type branched-subunit amino acid transport system substrate-binding protein
VEVLYEDDQFAPQKTVSAFQKLVRSDRVDAIVCVGSTPCNAIAAIAQKSGTPLFAWASDSKVAQGRPLVVRTYPDGRSEGRRVADEATSRGINQVALITATNDYSDSWRRGFAAAFAKGTILIDQEVPSDSIDFRSLVLKAIRVNARHFAICLNPGQSAAFAKQVRTLASDANFFGCESLADTGEVAMATGALDNAWFATIPVTREFRAKYMNSFGNDSVLSGAAIHYELAHIFKKIAVHKSENLISRLQALSWPQQGVVGEYSVAALAGDTYFDIKLKIEQARR